VTGPDTTEHAGDATTATTPKPSGGKKRARRLVTWGAAGVIVVLLLVGSLVYTEQSSFCPTCHEMGPYYTAWKTGPHAKDASCVDCHVDAGVIAHLVHKPTALKEVWDHFFADNRFPNYTVDVPNSRCIRCHPSVPDKIGALFSHAKHQNKATCKDCHTQAGHPVTLAALDAIGVLKSGATTHTVNGMTASSIPGHKKVICQNCHNQANMKCSSCHQPPHENRGECSNCHKPGTGFVFVHPAGTDCVSCHKPPTNHFSGDCGGCHTPAVPFAKTAYKHDPGSNCGSCHNAPANHFGASCSTCHKPGVPFKKATFSHPARVGDHSYRSFPCAKCHPNGYASSYCTCHKGNPPNGD
jgi:nitrate/TMAO reductase-like tetraheme cytochrome c subunit